MNIVSFSLYFESSFAGPRLAHVFRLALLEAGLSEDAFDLIPDRFLDELLNQCVSVRFREHVPALRTGGRIDLGCAFVDFDQKSLVAALRALNLSFHGGLQ